MARDLLEGVRADGGILETAFAILISVAESFGVCQHLISQTVDRVSLTKEICVNANRARHDLDSSPAYH